MPHVGRMRTKLTSTLSCPRMATRTTGIPSEVPHALTGSFCSHLFHMHDNRRTRLELASRMAVVPQVLSRQRMPAQAPDTTQKENGSIHNFFHAHES